MGTPGLVALILVALAVLLAAAALVARGRRRAAVPAGPRTVAELVQLRAERAGQSAAPAPVEVRGRPENAVPRRVDPGPLPSTVEEPGEDVDRPAVTPAASAAAVVE